MQFLTIDKNTTLSDLSSQVGSSNLDALLHINNVKRTPRVGKAFFDMCDEIIQSSKEVSFARKISLVNSYTADSDIFEQVALADERGWKLIDSVGVLQSSMKIPTTVTIPDSSRVLGNKQPLQQSVYDKVIQCLYEQKVVDPAIFNPFTSSGSIFYGASYHSQSMRSQPMQWFPIPWGEVTLYSSLDDSMIDFPVFPEEYQDARKAEYATMPDMLYQYEPWYMYKGSGPRSNTIHFHFHRDMWTGDHRDGKANELIRACQANCYPEYNGSAVNTSISTLYIHGKALITGIITDVTVDWSGPLGQDMWFLDCKLSITFTEISTIPLNYSSVKGLPLIG